jgi:hypothetical protein
MTYGSMPEQIKEAQQNKLHQRESKRKERSWTMKEMPNKTNAI